MKYVLWIGGGVAVVGLLFFALNSSLYQEKQSGARGDHVVYTEDETGVRFTYRSGADGYVLQELARSADTDTAFVKLVTLTLRSDHEQFIRDTEASEGPPSIGMAIFERTPGVSAAEWVRANPSLSNVDLMVGDISTDGVIDGVEAAQYRIDGLYLNDMVAVAHGSYLYLFSGAFLEEDSTIRRDFAALLDSVSFWSRD